MTTLERDDEYDPSKEGSEGSVMEWERWRGSGGLEPPRNMIDDENDENDEIEREMENDSN
jgi:hypothetical protein